MFFKRNKTKKKIITISDNLFGQISFIEDSGDENHWFGAVEFEREIIEILIYNNTPEINDFQKEIFNELKKKYTEIKPNIEDFINRTSQERKINNKTYSVSRDFTISHISIYASSQQEFEIAYKLNNDFYWFEVYFKDFKPIHLGVSA